MAVDGKHRVIVACRGEQADGFEGDAVEPLLERARFACPELASIGADSGFAAERVWRAAERRRIIAFVPPQPTMLPKGEKPTTEAQRQALAARSRCKSPAGIEAHRRRMADAEGVIGELKNQGTAARAQQRGTPYFHVQLPLNRTAVNCKRLAITPARRRAGSQPRRRPRRRSRGRTPPNPRQSPPIRPLAPRTPRRRSLRLRLPQLA